MSDCKKAGRTQEIERKIKNKKKAEDPQEKHYHSAGEVASVLDSPMGNLSAVFISLFTSQGDKTEAEVKELE